jgi:hypothetical protein
LNFELETAMGRTVQPYSHVWEEERHRWLKFRRALRREDQAHLDRLFELARLHLQAGVYASNPWPLESMLLSMLLEHQKAISALLKRLELLEQGKGEGEGETAGHPETSVADLSRRPAPQ